MSASSTYPGAPNCTLSLPSSKNKVKCLTKFPIEILLDVFSHLPYDENPHGFARVCHCFKAVVEISARWKTVIINTTHLLSEPGWRQKPSRTLFCSPTSLLSRVQKLIKGLKARPDWAEAITEIDIRTSEHDKKPDGDSISISLFPLIPNVKKMIIASHFVRNASWNLPRLEEIYIYNPHDQSYSTFDRPSMCPLRRSRFAPDLSRILRLSVLQVFHIEFISTEQKELVNALQSIMNARNRYRLRLKYLTWSSPGDTMLCLIMFVMCIWPASLKTTAYIGADGGDMTRGSLWYERQHDDRRVHDTLRALRAHAKTMVNLAFSFHGVRYPDVALTSLKEFKCLENLSLPQHFDHTDHFINHIHYFLPQSLKMLQLEFWMSQPLSRTRKECENIIQSVFDLIIETKLQDESDLETIVLWQKPGEYQSTDMPSEILHTVHSRLYTRLTSVDLGIKVRYCDALRLQKTPAGAAMGIQNLSDLADEHGLYRCWHDELDPTTKAIMSQVFRSWREMLGTWAQEMVNNVLLETSESS